MKKYLLSFAVLLMGASVLTSCDDDDESYVPRPVAVNNGVYVVNSGNKSSGIDGSLTYVSAETWVATEDAFSAVNNRNLGLTANDGIVYGSKLYVVVTGENSIEVIDNNTLKSIKRISTTDVMGEDKGKQPRHLTAYGNCIFVSTYDGYVAAIDTVSFTATATYQVGSFPEGLSAYNGILYVANSDYGDGNNPSLSIVNLKTNEVTEFKHDLITNPVGIVANEYGLFVLDYGTYDGNQLNAGVRKVNGESVSIVAAATAMAVGGTKIYTVNAPYSYPAVTPSYEVYDMATGATSTFIADGNSDTNPDAPFSPSAIAADPVRGYVYIASYQKNPDTGYAGYAIAGQLYVYDINGNLVKTCKTGVGPTAVVPNTTIVYE